MLIVIYADCRYAECFHTKCRGAAPILAFFTNVDIVLKGYHENIVINQSR